MADNNTADTQLPPAPFRFVAQYLKDLSFENPGIINALTNPQREAPRGQVKFDVQARLTSPMQYEVCIILGINAMREQETVYIAHVEYAGLFDVSGVPEDRVMPLLMIEAPRLLFPFAREILAAATNAGAYPPVLLNPVDFAAFYQSHVQRRAAAGEPALTLPQA